MGVVAAHSFPLRPKRRNFDRVVVRNVEVIWQVALGHIVGQNIFVQEVDESCEIGLLAQHLKSVGKRQIKDRKAHQRVVFVFGVDTLLVFGIAKFRFLGMHAFYLRGEPVETVHA